MAYLLFFAALLNTPAFGAAINVADGDLAGLIAAINTANTNGEADVINLAANGTYTLTAVDNVQGSYGPSGLPAIYTELTINGNNAVIERSAAGGVPNFRIFYVGAAASVPVAFNDLTLRNGLTGFDGGAIINFSSLTMHNCVVTGNIGHSGGGIYTRVGSDNSALLKMVDCRVTGNTSTLSGGGLICQGPATLTRCTILFNSAGTGAGGIGLSSSQLQIVDCSIRSNQAVGAGGGIRSDGTLTILDSSISDNEAANGGGIYHARGDLSLGRTTINHNLAQGDGGGLFTYGDSSVFESVICDNSALNNGGGVFSSYSSQAGANTFGHLEMINCTLSSNTAGVGGGLFNRGGHAIIVLGTVVATHCTINDNSPSGIVNDVDGEITLSNTIVANSSAGDCIINGGALIDAGYNIIEDGSCVSAPMSLSGDPMLGPLLDNGGPTRTHEPLVGSPAIDAGDCDGGAIQFDQRHSSRAWGTACDIGSYEVVDCSIPAVIPDGDLNALILAIRCANDTPGPDTIDLAANGNYAIAATENTTDGLNGLPSILTDITINGNNAVLDRVPAGDIRAFHVDALGDLTLNGMTIRNCGSGLPFDGGNGGAIRSRGTLEINNSQILDCTSDFEGGGIYHDGGALVLNHSLVSGNTSEFGNAGGVFSSGGALTIANSEVSNNRAGLPFGANAGGIVAAVGAVEIRDSLVQGNRATGNVGGIWNTTQMTILRSTIADNVAADGFAGGIRNSGGGVLTVVDSTISGNRCTETGGGIRNTGAGSAVNVLNSSLSGNTAGAEGGGIYEDGAAFSLDDVTIEDNVASGDGGGVYLTSTTSATLIDTAISSNTSGGRGGGLFHPGQATLMRLRVEGNESDTGGGIYNAGTLLLTDASIGGNTSNGDGGGIYNELSLTAERSTISGNTTLDVQADGGGLFNAMNAAAAFVNATFSNNTAGDNGGGIYADRSTVDLQACTMAGNGVVAGVGGGITIVSGTVETSNTIVAGSIGADCFNSLGTFVDNGFNVIEDGSCISNASSMSGDPMLGPLADNGGPTMTHALLPGSPAIDAGDCDGGAVTEDQRGVSRPQGAACDIGAFEAILGDFDNDGDVDLSDFAQFSLCFAGANVPPAGTCPAGVAADFDNDGDVDLSDFAAFSLNFTGPL